MMSVRKSFSMTSGVFLFLFALSFVSGQYDLELASQSDLESIEEIQELLRNVQTIFETRIASKVQEESDEELEKEEVVDSNGCSCSGLKCSCCKFLNSRKLKLNGNACLSVTYLKRNYGILVTLKYKERPLFAKEISAKNPPPICVGIPALKAGGSVCIQFYNLNAGAKTLSGCGRLIGKLVFVTVIKINVGCFNIKTLNETEQVGALELPYLDVPEALPEGPETIYIGDVEMEEIKPSFVKRN